jgi:hypothetical protein
MDIDKEQTNKAKYLKYKLKYLALKKQYISEGGGGGTSSTVKEQFFGDSMYNHILRDIRTDKRDSKFNNYIISIISNYTVNNSSHFLNQIQSESKTKTVAEAINVVLKKKSLNININDYLLKIYNDNKT